jgi:hypothetical protein
VLNGRESRKSELIFFLGLGKILRQPSIWEATPRRSCDIVDGVELLLVKGSQTHVFTKNGAQRSRVQKSELIFFVGRGKILRQPKIWANNTVAQQLHV